MRPAVWLLIFLLCVDAIAWAHFVGLVAGLCWLTVALCVAWGHGWLDRASAKIPRNVRRRRLA